MNRSVKIAGAQTGKTHFEDGYRRLAKAQANRSMEEYKAAIALFDKATSLGHRDPLCAEAKVSACFRLYILEAEEHRRDKRRSATRSSGKPDGTAYLKNALAGAQAIIDKHKMKRWQPYYLLAECLLQTQSYADAQRAIDTCRQTASYTSGKAAVRDKVAALANRIWTDEADRARRKAGRAEIAAIAHEMHREAERKKLIDYTPMLQDDIWLLIAQYASSMDPLALQRMSQVDKRLRGALLSAPGLWNSLTLSNCRKLEGRVKAHLDRCAGGDRPGLLSVTVKQGCDRLEAFPDIQDRLRDQMGNVREFDVELDTLDHVLTIWRHKLPKVAKLRVSSANYAVASDMTFGLVPHESSSLRELALANISLQPSAEMTARYQADRAAGRLVPPMTIPNPAVQLAELRRFSMRGGQLFQGLDEYLAAMPKLEHLRLDAFYQSSTMQVVVGGPVNRPSHTVTLEHLDTVELHQLQPHGSTFFHDLYAPNLSNLEIVSLNAYNGMHMHPGPVLDLGAQLSSRGLKDALANLTSLELLRSVIYTAQLVPLLEKMVSLRHLGLGFTGVQNDLIQALVKGKMDAEGKRVEILPKLEALCVAGMPDLNAADLRDLICARKGLPLHTGKMVDGSTPPGTQRQGGGSQVVKRARGPFGAARNPNQAASEGVTRSAASSQTPQANTASSSATQGGATQKTVPAQPKLTTTPLRWLNVDHCHSLDFSVVDWIKTQVSFISAIMSYDGGVTDRMMGKGQWTWDLDREICRGQLPRERRSDDEEFTGPCGVVHDKATGKWVIMHTCGVYVKSGPGYVSRSSQAEPGSQTLQIPDSQASQDAVRAKEKQKEKVSITRGGWGWGSNMPSGSRDGGGSSSGTKRAREE